MNVARASTRRHPAVDEGGPAPPNSHAVRRRADEERWREPRCDHRVGAPTGAAEQTRPGDHHPARHVVQPSPPGPARRTACAQREATARPNERDRLLLRVLWATGARVSEALDLRLVDVRRDSLVLPN